MKLNLKLSIFFFCIYHNFTTEVSFPQIINTKMHTKTACSSRVIFQYVNRKILEDEGIKN